MIGTDGAIGCHSQRTQFSHGWSHLARLGRGGVRTSYQLRKPGNDSSILLVNWLQAFRIRRQPCGLSPGMSVQGSQPVVMVDLSQLLPRAILDALSMG